MFLYIQVEQYAGHNFEFARQPAFQTLFTQDEEAIAGAFFFQACHQRLHQVGALCTRLGRMETGR
ncbi:hypothetical protein BK659_08170 [Pseudomonas brassicacearum]|uniref:Uncharacterized protein n=1 Tax=Pseudomonas brassicacearum TaxID=930166 RepID=A0A423H9K6_9PSED|nr:hypothetical protein BK659_08170 [Pseudomonas brassicacearum]